MDNPVLALTLPSLLIVPAMGLLSRINSRSAVGRELRRKALHIGVGLVALSFPLILTEDWIVVAALSVVVTWMLAVRRVPSLRRRFGSVLHDAGRESAGELYFAVAIAGLLLISSGHSLLFTIPVLILTLADALAAVVGRAWPIGALDGPARGKTVSGSAAFLATAWFVTWPLLAAYTSLDGATVVAIAAIVASLTCITEAISSRGLDNLLVPAVAWLILNALLGV